MSGKVAKHEGTITYISLFSGIEAARVAWELFGWGLKKLYMSNDRDTRKECFDD